MKLFFKGKGEIPSQMKKNLREFVVIRPALQEMLKEVLKTEENDISQTLGSTLRKEEHQRSNKWR